MIRSHCSRRGIALLLTLGFIAALALLVTGVMGALRVRLVEGERRIQRDTLRADADSALAVAMARLAVFRMDAGGVYLNSADLEAIASDPLAGHEPMSGGVVTMELRDESAYFQLNTPDVRRLRELFEDVGVPEERADGLAQALADWIDTDEVARVNGAESGFYGQPGVPSNRPLRRFAELRAVKGFSEEFFNADGSLNELGKELARVSTLLVTDGRNPNVNCASEAVLRVLSVRNGADPGSLLGFRIPLDYPNERVHRGVFATAGDMALVAAPSALAERVSYAARQVRATIRVKKGDLVYLTEALLTPKSDSKTAPVVLRARMDGGLFDDLK